MSVLSLENLTKRFPRGDRAAVDSLTLQVEAGEVFALLGESGSGKTTTLRLIAGFDVPSDGHIQILGRTVASPSIFVPPEERGVRMVFQESALFPHLTVAGNLEFAVPRTARSQKRQKVAAALSSVNLRGLEHRFPHELSGGQRQRVELARALIAEPTLLLLDEPFSGLDVSLRAQLRAEIAEILHRAGTTSILVTHDVQDAFMVSDRVAVLKDGLLQQVGSPREAYLRPSTPYVAGLFGTINLIAGTVVEQGIQTPFGVLKAGESTVPASGAPTMISIRPECFLLDDSDSPPLTGRVARTTFLGRFQEVVLTPDMPSDSPTLLIVHLPVELPIEPGQRLALRPRPGSAQQVPWRP